jgi:hypothetical protein
VFYGPQQHEVLERPQYALLWIGVLHGEQTSSSCATEARWKQRWSLVRELVVGCASVARVEY